MKEKIYTIPVNEAYEQNCECPLCFLERKLEEEAVEYALGAAMMEPDYRVISNEKGYCNKHYSMLFKRPNKLSLALVLDTHLEEIRKNFSSVEKDINKLEKGTLFKKPSTECLDRFTQNNKKTTCSCVICDKTKHTTERYIEVFFWLWKNDEEFKEKLKNSKGLCIPHFTTLCEKAFSNLSHADASDFVKLIYNKQLSELDRIQEDIHRFTLKFDYRNRDMEWGTAADAPIRTIEKLSGYILTDCEEN
ncbi:MAG: ABC transporter substrate-binding protein [Clostridia bacterium]|nr:ABC transporter substrate-binding protein [Clostridia bacterium]